MGLYIKGLDFPKEGSSFVIVIHPDGMITDLYSNELRATAIHVPEDQKRTIFYEGRTINETDL